MLQREMAYKLAGRKHKSPESARLAMQRERLLCFKGNPPQQAQHAAEALMAIEGLDVTAGPRENSLRVRYSLMDYSQADIEAFLVEHGFQLDNSLCARLRRAMIRFGESTQRHNLDAPQRLTKRYDQGYVKAYSHHAHGDHDDTPVELREYK